MDALNMGKKCLCCLDPISTKPTVVKLLDCNHEVCLECFSRWKKMKDTCPLCRCKITAVRETTIDKSKS